MRRRSSHPPWTCPWSRLSGANNAFLLDFGNVTVDTGIVNFNSELSIANVATGPADNLDGMFDFTNVDDFMLTDFNDFVNLAAGDLIRGLMVGFSVDTTGMVARLFEDVLELDTTSVFPTLNPIGLDPIFLTIRLNLVSPGQQVDEPGTLVLPLFGLLVLLVRRQLRLKMKQAA